MRLERSAVLECEQTFIHDTVLKKAPVGAFNE
jgi:hypothetical protein